jgi:WD40 repeat protein
MTSRQAHTLLLTLALALTAEASLLAQQPEQRSERIDVHGDPLPEGASARLGTLWLGSELLTSDGKTIVTFSGERALKFWDGDTGKLRERRELPTKRGFDAVLSRDGRLLAGREYGIDNPLDLWDLRAGKRIHRLRLPQGAILRGTQFSPDGKTLAGKPTDKSHNDVLLWDVATGKPREFKGHEGPPNRYTFSLAFSPDGKLLAATDDRRLLLWDIATGKPRELKGWSISQIHLSFSLAFSPDGKFLVAEDRSRLLCWDATTAELLWHKEINSFLMPGFRFTPDGRTLIASPGSDERDWHAWETATGKPAGGLKLPPEHDMVDLAVAPDGRTLLFAKRGVGPGTDNRVRVWDLREGKLLHTLGEGTIGPFFPDGKSFLTNDGALQRWELATGRPMFPDSRKFGHHGRVFRMVYSRDGKLLASAGEDQTIRLWDTATAKPLHVFSGHDNVVGFSMDFTPDGKFLVSGPIQDKLHIWDTETGKVVRRIPLHDPKDKDKDPTGLILRVTPDGRTILVSEYRWEVVTDAQGVSRSRSSSYLSRWELATGERKSRDAIDSSGLLFSPDGRLLTAGRALLDTVTKKGRALRELPGVSEFGGLYAFSGDGRRVAGLITREDDERHIRSVTAGIQVWDTETGRTVRCIRFAAEGEYKTSAFVSEGVAPLALSPDGRCVAAVDAQGLWVWDLATGRVVLKRPSPEPMSAGPFASCLAFAPDGRTLATGNRDSTILIWRLTPPKR